jgi:hypothetical protein
MFVHFPTLLSLNSEHTSPSFHDTLFHNIIRYLSPTPGEKCRLLKGRGGFKRTSTALTTSVCRLSAIGFWIASILMDVMTSHEVILNPL